MIKEFASGIHGASMLMVILMAIFFICFVTIVWKTWRVSNEKTDHLSRLPFMDGDSHHPEKRSL